MNSHSQDVGKRSVVANRMMEGTSVGTLDRQGWRTNFRCWHCLLRALGPQSVTLLDSRVLAKSVSRCTMRVETASHYIWQVRWRISREMFSESLDCRKVEGRGGAAIEHHTDKVVISRPAVVADFKPCDERASPEKTF